jgi:hypothetical protein
MNYLNLTRKADGVSITTEVRNLVLNDSVMVLHRAFDTAKMYEITLKFDSEKQLYTNETYEASAEAVYKIATPERLVRVARTGKNAYWGDSGCTGDSCPP